MTLEMWVGISAVATALLGVLAAVLGSSHRLGERITEVKTDLTGQIAEIKKDLTGQIVSLDTKIDSVKAELTGQIAEVKTELTGQIAEVKVDLTGQIIEVKKSVQVVDDRVFVMMSGAVLKPRPEESAEAEQPPTAKRA